MATAKKTRVKRSGAQDPTSAVEFLRDMALPGAFGTVVAINPDDGKCTGFGYASDAVSDVQGFIESNAAASKNLYWTPNPLKTLVNKKPCKSDVKDMRYATLDIDDPSESALEKLRGYPLPPSMIVFSGGGYNAYWELQEPVHANGNIKELEAVNKKLIADLSGDKGTWNLDRILRLPGTINYPNATKLARGRVPVASRLVEHHPDRVYSLDEFGAVTVDNIKKEAPAESPGADKVDRSKDLLRKIAVDMAKGLDDDEIRQKHRAHAHAIDQADPLRAIQRCIDKVRGEALGVVEQIKARNALIFVSGKLLVAWPAHVDDGLPRMTNITDARNYWKKIQRGKVNPVDMWLASPDRTEFSGFTFRPGAEDTGDKLNLFQGWGVDPDPAGSCALFLQHLLEVICDNDADVYDYVIQWFANMVQEPQKLPGTALAFSSGQGAGKGRVPEYIGSIFGAHLSRMSGADQLLGRFNDTLAGKLVVFGDEAAWPNDKRGMDKLKSYITEKRITVERKHIPAIEIDNFCRFIFATNNKHSAPVEIDDRRFVVMNVSNARINDFDYWNALEAERCNGGPAAFLHYLLNLKITRNLRETPKTAALAEQKLLSLDDVGQFVRQLLLKKSHKLDGGFDSEKGMHRTVPLEFGEVIGTDTLHRFYLDYAKRAGIKYPRSLDGLGVNVRRYFSLVKREPRSDERKTLNLGKGRGIQVYALPTLEQARASFEGGLGQKVAWPTWKEGADNGQ